MCILIGRNEIIHDENCACEWSKLKSVHVNKVNRQLTGVPGKVVYLHYTTVYCA